MTTSPDKRSPWRRSRRRLDMVRPPRKRRNILRMEGRQYRVREVAEEVFAASLYGRHEFHFFVDGSSLVVMRWTLSDKEAVKAARESRRRR